MEKLRKPLGAISYVNMIREAIKRAGLIALVSIILLCGAPISFFPHQASASDLPLFEYRGVMPSGGEQYVPDQIIVKFKIGIPGTVQADLNESLNASMISASPFGKFEVIQIPVGKTVLEMVEAYSKQAVVEYAEPNYIAHGIWSPNDPLYSYQWHFNQINLSGAWDLDTTAPLYGGDPSIVVAILDSGVAYENYAGYQKAPDLASTNFWVNSDETPGNGVDDDGNGYVDDVKGWDFINNDAHPNDDHSHGTHVCGTVAQSTNNSLGVAGIAFNTTIMPVKVLDVNLSGTYAQVVNGIYYATNNGAKIINMSLSGETASPTLENAVAYAYNHGVAVICAAGNDYNTGNNLQYPAAYDAYCIAVGATRFDQTRAPYSSTGAYLDLVAPGGDLTVDQNGDGYGDGYGDGVLQQTFNPNTKDPTDFAAYWFLQGTSMACPHVAGVAALILANHPSYTPDQVRQALQSTATDLGVAGRDDVYGWGLLNAVSAVSFPFVKLLGADDAVATGTAGANYLVIDRFAAVATGSVTEIRVKCTASGSVKVALYTDVAGSPGTLLNANNTGAGCIAGWNNITIPSTPVTTGTYYWIAYNSSSNCVGNFAFTGGAILYRVFSYSNNFPASAGTGFATYSGYHSLVAGWNTGPTPLTITTTSLPDGTVGVAYSQTLQASGGTGSYTWSITSGSLPAGLTLTPSTGLISGNPTTAATSPFTAQVNDGSTTASQPLSITVTVPLQKLLGADDAVATGTAGANHLLVDRFAAVASGNVTQVRVKCTASGSVKVALYTDNAGSPGTLLNANDTGASVVTGWNIITLPSTPVTMGTYYWIAYNSSSNCVGNFVFSGGSLLYRAFSYSTDFPASAGSGFTTYADHHSLIAGWGVVIPEQLPDPPSLLSPGTVITFKWGTSTRATTYWLQVNTASDFSGTNAFNAEVGNVTVREVTTGLSLGTTYYWRVKAGNSSGWGAWSSVRSVLADTVSASEQRFTLSINGQPVVNTTTPVTWGSISVNPAPGADGKYAKDSIVALNAQPAAGYSWTFWTGTNNDAINPTTITMTNNKTVTATGEGNIVRLSNTTHIYTKIFNEGNIDNSDGNNSIDGDFNTRFGYGNSGGEGGREITIISEHDFAVPSTINQITYRMYADARANGNYIRTHNIELYVQYYDTDWHDVPGSHYSAGGGEGEAGFDSGTVTYPGTLSNVTKIRAYCHSYSYASGGEAGCNSEAWVYEIQGYGPIM